MGVIQPPVQQRMYVDDVMTDPWVRYFQGTTKQTSILTTEIVDKTISSGVITLTGSQKIRFITVDSESAAASDDLNTISGGNVGEIAILQAEDNARTVVVKDGTNIKLMGDCSLGDTEKKIALLCVSSGVYHEIARQLITNIVGTLDIQHTSTEANDHALEIDVDAAGYGDVKALDIAYITGAISPGEDEGVILINIDEIAAAGGDVFAVEVLATDGDAGIYALKAAALVGPIHQDSGVFINPTLGTDNTPTTNVPYMIDGLVANTTDIFEAQNEYIIIGANAAFEEIEFILTTNSSISIKPTFWYSISGTNQFTQFTPVDGTNGFRNTGVVAWDASDLTGHVADDVTGKFDIKIIRTRVNIPTEPVLGYAKTAATTEYIWDKEGNVNIKNLAISDLTASQVVVTDGNKTLASRAIGIADDNIVEMDDADAADDDYAKFTARGLEGRDATEVKTDLSLENVENTVHSIDAHTMAIDGRDVSADGIALDSLNDNSMADALHRHSELSASDGTPDAVVSVDSDGILYADAAPVGIDILYSGIIGTHLTVGNDITVGGTVDGVDIAARDHAQLHAVEHKDGGSDDLLAAPGIIGGDTPAAAAFTDSSISGILSLIGGKILFPATQSPSAGANTLDDYEEGGWTPDLQFGGAKVGITYSTQAGAYIKIGKVVVVIFAIVLTSKGTSTGNARIYGLPFTMLDSPAMYPGVAIRFAYITFADMLNARGVRNTTYMELKEVTNAGAPSSIQDSNFANNSIINATLFYAATA
ncbi:MAG: hypothetical protein E3J94_07095 [Desulfobacteraceae bacterium]|nr:MAG: hypothetical protein E3J94_07095 [Desulfobacteraceae bacterium]